MTGSKTEDGWIPIDSAPEGVEIMTKIDDEFGPRNLQTLIRRTRIPGVTSPMFWVPDGSMYVYYTPTHWKPLNGARTSTGEA